MFLIATGKGAPASPRDRAESPVIARKGTPDTGKPPSPSSTDGHLSLAPLLILLSSSLRNPIGLSERDARRSARPIGLLPQGPGGD
jgi:hypothetical protein